MSRGRLVREDLQLGTSDIIQHISDLEHLKVAVFTFGRACSGMRFERADRVSDLLELDDVTEASLKRVRLKEAGRAS
jgi:hypothetical protein